MFVRGVRAAAPAIAASVTPAAIAALTPAPAPVSEMRTAPHPSGKILHFDTRRHAYAMGGGARLMSVSAVLNQHFPFDADRIARIVATRTDRTVAAVLAEWTLAARLGSSVHGFLEDALRASPEAVATIAPRADAVPEAAAFYPAAAAAVRRLTAAYEILAIEAMVCSPRLGVAGTIDVVARNRRTGAVLVGDWKTSGTPDSGFRFGSFDASCPAALGLGHVPNGKATRYAMQVLAYGYLLRSEGYLPGLLGLRPGEAAPPLEYGLMLLSRTQPAVGAATGDASTGTHAPPQPPQTPPPPAAPEGSARAVPEVTVEFRRVDPDALLPSPDPGDSLSTDALLERVLRV